MAKIEHNSMRSVKDPGPGVVGPQTYVVDDASNLEERISQFEAPAAPPVQAVETKPVSKDLEKLIFIGRVTSEVDISGSKFELGTLLNKEQDEIVKMLYTFTNPGDLFAVRSLTLAHALKSVDGMSLDDIQVGGDFESDFKRRVEIINCLQVSVVEQLFTEYEKLLGNVDKSVEGDEIKNS